MDINLNKSLTLITSTLEHWYEVSLKNLPNLVVAIFVIMVFTIIAKLSRNFILKISRKSSLSVTVSELISKTVFAIIILAGIFVALGLLQLDKTVTSLLAGAGVIGLALGFAFQEIASNFVSGVFIAIKQPYSIGDIVEVDNFKGKVKSIDLRTTSLMTFYGIEVLIPNKSMFTKSLKNYNTTPVRRLDLNVGVSYDVDLERVRTITVNALSKVSKRVKCKKVEVFFTKFDSSSINFTARVWINYKAEIDYMHAQDQAIVEIKNSFEQNSISIPYPIRTLEFNQELKLIEKLASNTYFTNQ